jgi:hypothetical protein
MSELNLPKQYDPRDAQNRFYELWVEKGYFHADAASTRPAYSIVIPPPNVTGALHLGHALNNTLQDILIRWRRMQGYNVLWMPGASQPRRSLRRGCSRKRRRPATTLAARPWSSASGPGKTNTRNGY